MPWNDCKDVKTPTQVRDTSRNLTTRVRDTSRKLLGPRVVLMSKSRQLFRGIWHPRSRIFPVHSNTSPKIHSRKKRPRFLQRQCRRVERTISTGGEQRLAISAPTKTRDAAIPPHLPGSMPRLGMSSEAIIYNG